MTMIQITGGYCPACGWEAGSAEDPEFQKVKEARWESDPLLRGCWTGSYPITVSIEAARRGFKCGARDCCEPALFTWEPVAEERR